jgi:hypothetical protein
MLGRRSHDLWLAGQWFSAGALNRCGAAPCARPKGAEPKATLPYETGKLKRHEALAPKLPNQSELSQDIAPDHEYGGLPAGPLC